MLDNKKAQVGSTMTWFIATIVIVTILIVFYVVSLVVAGQNKLDHQKIKLGISGDESFFKTQSTIAFLMTPEGKRENVNIWMFEELKRDPDYEDYDDDLRGAYASYLSGYLKR